MCQLCTAPAMYYDGGVCRDCPDSGPRVGILVAVLVAVFVPTAFVPGIPGIFYQQFAVTIAAATVFSLLTSLTLSPAMAALPAAAPVAVAGAVAGR